MSAEFLRSIVGDQGRGLVIGVCGRPGSGKTETAKVIAEITGGTVIRSDVVRKALFENSTYSPAEIDKLYGAIMGIGVSLLRMGRMVIVDATFSAKRHRDLAREVTGKLNASFLLLEVVCDNEALVRERMDSRIGDPSEARYEHRVALQGSFERLEETHAVINNGGSFSDLKRELISILSGN